MAMVLSVHTRTLGTDWEQTRDTWCLNLHNDDKAIVAKFLGKKGFATKLNIVDMRSYQPSKLVAWVRFPSPAP
ncbi:hypothetical protein AAC03nite_34440 [Alicyclobacillus acidoterrestris]|nr:hypothetical protein AAC03nite_34440 [Alicyclobacillus acidoterrestris]